MVAFRTMDKMWRKTASCRPSCRHTFRLSTHVAYFSKNRERLHTSLEEYLLARGNHLYREGTWTFPRAAGVASPQRSCTSRPSRLDTYPLPLNFNPTYAPRPVSPSKNPKSAGPTVWTMARCIALPRCLCYVELSGPFAVSPCACWTPRPVSW